VKLVVGLGNPGKRYEATRHNLGFMVVDKLASRWNVGRFAERFRGWFGTTQVRGVAVGLLKPATFVNRSGEAVLQAMQFYKLEMSDLLVVTDDMDLPPGRIRIRPKGSAGGHKGLADIIGRLGSDQFARLRIGIGKPTDGDAVEFVLSRFLPEEVPAIERAIERAADAVECWITEGLDAAMNRYNRPEAVAEQAGRAGSPSEDGTCDGKCD